MQTTTEAFRKKFEKFLEIDRVVQIDPKDEYLKIKVLKKGNLLGYGVVDVSYEDGKTSNKHRHFFTFPDTEVLESHTIYLHSGKHSENKKYVREVPHKILIHTIHHFYVGGTNVWNDGGDHAWIIKFTVEDEKKIR